MVIVFFEMIFSVMVMCVLLEVIVGVGNVVFYISMRKGDMSED